MNFFFYFDIVDWFDCNKTMVKSSTSKVNGTITITQQGGLFFRPPGGHYGQCPFLALAALSSDPWWH